VGKEEIKKNLSIRDWHKGETLIREGHYHPNMYFLQKGAARGYYIKDGTEVNTWFAFENELVGSFQNYLNNPSQESIELLENCRLVVIHLAPLQKLLSFNIQVSNFVRLIVEEYTAFLEERVFGLQFMSSMERYLYLLEHEPETLRRVSLTHLSSYLGITRETLSRLRAKILL
jgi:CRP-like cAMP-binding protein